jgi:HK97 gp10 family phage protein
MARRQRRRGKQAYIELDGVAEINRAMAQLKVGVLREVRAAVKESAEEIEADAKRRAPVRAANPPYPVGKAVATHPPGRTRDAVKTIYLSGGLTASVGTKYIVARWNEFGTKHMPAQPFMGPAWAAGRPRYLARLAEAVGRAGREVDTE